MILMRRRFRCAHFVRLRNGGDARKGKEVPPRSLRSLAEWRQMHLSGRKGRAAADVMKFRLLRGAAALPFL